MKLIYGVLENIFSAVVKILSLFSILMLGFIVIFIAKESIPVFQYTSFYNFISGSEWRPISSTPQFGILPMILASLYVSGIAVLIALPLGTGVAVFLNMVLNIRLSNSIRPIIDVMAGIPSVIYGFFGLLVIIKFFETSFSLASGESVLAAGIILSIMVLPYIIATCDDSMAKIIASYKISSDVLGVSSWHLVKYLILPGSFRAIISALILGLSRAMGETLAVMMVIGNSPVFPEILGKGETIPALIALEMSGAQVGSNHYHGLFAAGLVLMLILLLINSIFYYLQEKLVGR
ncbi:phosphate ABC transporter permease subunit PstC [Phosphitispora sp. TUW77]|uniref:phosphate ABC transporter permease subunit PstC n=1 Tax=Phosphitispora sp. TUW77 TaxID=3152361 RepID=UPI003AB8B544